MSNFLKSFLPFILFFVIQLAVTVPMVIIQIIYHYFVSGTTVDGVKGLLSYGLSLLHDTAFLQRLSLVFAVVLVIFFCIWYRNVFVRPFQRRRKKYWSGFSIHIIFALIFLAFGLQYVMRLFVTAAAWIHPKWLFLYQSRMELAGFQSMNVMFLIYTILLMPICEELAFRGLTYRFARTALPFWAANLLQAALFGIVRFDVIEGIYAFCLGLFLGWFCHVGHSIKYSMILHILFHFLGTVFFGFFDVLSTFSFWGSTLLGVLLTLFALYLFHSEFRIRNAILRRQRTRLEDPDPPRTSC